MAQKIIGLDIGSFSVKVSSISASFRSISWDGYHEFEIPHAGRSRPERAAAQVLQDLGKQVQGPGAIVVCALPGDRVMTRFVKLPFSDPKRVDSVLGFELEGQIPLGVEDINYAYQLLGDNADGDTEIFAAAVKHEYMRRYLEGLQDAGLDPRVLTLDTTSYVNLYDHLVGEGTVAFVDIGHKTTKLCIVEDGRLRLARSVGRGGHSLTQALADRFELEYGEAEQLKHQQATLPTGAGELPPTPLSEVCASSMQPLVMAVRQTCQSFARDAGRPVTTVLLTGGGSRVDGAVEWMQQQLGMPVRRLSLDALEFNKVGNTEGSATGAAKSLGLSLFQAGASRHLSTLNFRRGEYAYEGDFKYLTDKLAYLGGLAATLLIVAAVYGVVKNNSLQEALDHQYSALAAFTTDKLGQRESSFAKTLKKLQNPVTDEDEVKLFPPMTAIAVLDKVTAIQQRLNGAAVPGGPGQRLKAPSPTAMPPIRPVGTDRLRARPLTGSPGRLDAGVRRRLEAPRRGPGTGAKPDPISGRGPPADPLAAPGPDGGRTLDRPVAPGGAAGDGKGDGGGGEGEGAEPKVSEATKIELSQINIDVFGDVRVTAETHESNVKGKEDFRKAIQEEACFREVKRRDIGEVVSTGRHSDWVRFEVTFKVKCP